MIRVGHIPYLNCEPFFAYLSGFTYRLGADEEKAIAEFNRLRGFLKDAQC